MPLVVANMLLIKLIIIRLTSIASSLVNHLEVQLSRLWTLMLYIVIHLANSHYSCCHVRNKANALSSHTIISSSPTLLHVAYNYHVINPNIISFNIYPCFMCMCHIQQCSKFARSLLKDNDKQYPHKNRQATIATLICQTPVYGLYHRN